jgi:hypothetical protein
MLSSKTPYLLPVTLVGVLFFTGCANMTQTATTDPAQNATISGTVHGGRQAVSGATVNLMAAGNAGYGSAATVVDSVTSGSNGTFSFSGAYSCPSSSSTTESQYLYITASGGNAGAGTNSQAAFMVALGLCSTVLSNNPSVNLNEVTTVASITALQQFFKPDTTNGLGSIGTSSTNLTGLANAMATVPNMVNIATGTALASTTVSVPSSAGTLSGFTSNPTITVVPEQTKINTMADILAACVNTSGPTTSPASPNACNTLFSNAGSTTPLDTLQAAYYMTAKPFGVGTPASCATATAVTTAPSICTLFGLVTASSPFQSVLTAAPTDWTIGLTLGTNSTNTAGAYFFSYPSYLAVDGSDNLWIVNDVSTSATATTNSLVEISAVGVPEAQVLTGSTLIGPAGIVIDPSNNIFIPNYGSTSTLQSSVIEYTSGGTTKTFTTNKGPQRLASDGAGNIFVLEPSYKGLGDLEEIPAGSATATAATTIASGLTTDFSNLAIDSNYTIWVTGGGTGSSGGTSGYPYVYQFLYSSTSPNYPSSPSATTNAGGIAEPEQAIAIDSSNNVWLQNYGAETVAELSGKATVTGNSSSPYTTYTSLTKPEFQVMDGAGNIWVTDAATTTASPAGSVYEVLAGGTSTNPTTSLGFTHTYDEPYGIAIDGSGNVWVAGYASAASASVQSFITEIVGAAVPVVTPIAAGLPASAGGTNKLATKP